jgi:sec-independent protein translocase protein TatB
MPGFGDTTFIVLLALLLFGPKKLPVLARQLGKLMGEFRRASNEFRTQMEEELRISEQADRQKQIAAIEAAAPKPTQALPEPEQPHLPHPPDAAYPDPGYSIASDLDPDPPLINTAPVDVTSPEPMAIATSGTLNLMPPPTGLPIPNTIHTTAAPESTIEPEPHIPPEAHVHG